MSRPSPAFEGVRGQRDSYEVPAKRVCHKDLSISRWVNEPYPALNELLSSHDVARLTRRPCWVLNGLSLIGRFPKKLRFRGRGIGWRRSEVLEWISPDAVNVNAMAPVARAHPRRSRCKHASSSLHGTRCFTPKVPWTLSWKAARMTSPDGAKFRMPRL